MVSSSRMWRFIAFLLGLAASSSAVAECVATAYRTGEPIPTYQVLGQKSLQEDWDRYVAQYAESAWLIDVSGADLAPRSLLERCLVKFAPIDAKEQAKGADAEELVLHRPCDEFRVGVTHRLIVYAYCVELFGRNPDFFSAIRYRHANIAKRKRY